MITERKTSASLLAILLGLGIISAPISFSASAFEPTVSPMQDDPDPEDADDDAEPSKFESREALATILFGENEEINVAKDEIAAIDDAIAAKEAEIAALDPEAVDHATVLAALEAELVLLNDDLTAKMTVLDDLTLAFIAPLENLSPEQVFAMNRSFNGWVNNAFDVTLSDELIERLLSGDYNDKQIMFAIRAEFEMSKFEQLAVKMDEKGLADQAERMRSRGATQKDRFNGMVDGFGDEATTESRGAIQSATRDLAREIAQDAAKGQLQADVKRAAAEEMKNAARANSRGRN